MSQSLQALACRLERAQALQNERFNQAAGGRSLPVGGGYAHFRGEAHPLNQALGLIEPITEAELTAVESFLGAPTVLELSPCADPDLWTLLATRGYRVHQFQQLWVRPPADAEPSPAMKGGTARSLGLALRPPFDPHVMPGQSPGITSVSIEMRPAERHEADLYNRIVCAGFMDRDDWEDLEPPFRISFDVVGAWGFLAFVDGQPSGGGMLGIVAGVAMLSGTGVIPRFRGRGIQKALIHARLQLAHRLGCDLACASTAPGTASQRSFEACGFRVAYPKLEMARG